MRCLIIEDDESPRLLMARLIEGAGHRATLTATGDEALAAARRDTYDVAIVDLELPGMTGAQTIAALHHMAPSLPVLVVSGYDDRRHVLDAIDAGAAGYIVKDEIVDSLTRSLQEVRAGHSPMSPRVAGIVVRQLRRATSEPKVARTGAPVGQAKIARGTGRLPVVEKRAPVDDDDETR